VRWCAGSCRKNMLGSRSVKRLAHDVTFLSNNASMSVLALARSAGLGPV
jgi:hypothetical protein